ncbi:Hypothetical protein R9X50_00413000 [Acrodontium crateriforme]|uniref:Cyclohexanone monooxygenase n=1 Tax=Acrodontium crateriforme TaxID=150365 RepID=A0AAQ3MAH0_9PEZI|nr:Hypothetical protein R9X50_00413000 [Acrodontium crateriforme]
MPSTMSVDPQAQTLVYEFWAKKTGRRIKNLQKRAFLVPEEAPFAFGTKHSSLEQDYYECLDHDNVGVVDLKTSPTQELTEKGIISGGVEQEFDTIVMAIGFDAMTGSFTGMNLYRTDGRTMKERWSGGVFTYLGLCSSRCPNVFLVYGPQAPTAFTNGPVFIEVQVDVVVEFMLKMRAEGIKFIEAQPQAEQKWKQAIHDANTKTLLPLTDSWYMGANVRGKSREQLNDLREINNYEKECRAALED